MTQSNKSLNTTFTNHNNKLILGDFYCNESLEQEHKEFTFNKIRNDFNKDMVFQFFEDLNWSTNIDNLILKNINVYLSVYLPKYLTSFSNSNVNGNLNFGINDWGILTGIPFKDNLQNKQYLIKRYIQKIIKNQVSIDGNKLSDSQINKIINSISINIVKLQNKPIEKVKDIHLNKKIKKYFDQKRWIQSQFNYIKKREYVWKEKMNNYKSLFCIMRNLYTARQLYNFIKKNINDDYKCHEVLKDFWNYARTFTLPEHNKLQRDKRNPEKILYWLVTFKDYMVEKLCNQKPKFSELKQKVNKSISLMEKTNPIKLFYKITPLHKEFIENNIDFYIININVDGKNINFDELMYKESFIYDTEWKYKKRVFTENGPCCI